MNVRLELSAPSQIETECLAVVVLDDAEEGAKNGKATLQTSDSALHRAAAELIESGEVTGRLLETVMVHRPQGLKAKRLLLVGGGKAKNFSSYELRKTAGAAARFLKPKNIRSFTFAAPSSWTGNADVTAHSTYVFARGGQGDA